MGKYDPLYKYLSGCGHDEITLSLPDIERIIGDVLPTSAHMYAVWWSNSNTKAHPYSHAWTDAGYRTTDVAETLRQERITFSKW